jgi:hypothetical protein
MSMVNYIVEAGKLLITSKDWPAKIIPEHLKDKIVMDRTSIQNLRTVSVNAEGIYYSVIECNPKKVKRDIDGNDWFDKVMVCSSTGIGWLGQVRRYKKGREDWHFYKFD